MLYTIYNILYTIYHIPYTMCHIPHATYHRLHANVLPISATPSSPNKNPITFFQPPPEFLSLYSLNTITTYIFHPKLSPSNS